VVRNPAPGTGLAVVELVEWVTANQGNRRWNNDDRINNPKKSPSWEKQSDNNISARPTLLTEHKVNANIQCSRITAE
jgi:hypothetical protein